MADPIKIQVVLDDGDVKTGVDKIKGALDKTVDNATAAGKAAGKGYGEGFNNGASSALDAGAQSAKKKIESIADAARDAGRDFGNSLGGAIHAAFEGNFKEVLSKLGELREAAAGIGEAIGKTVVKNFSEEIKESGLSAEEAAGRFKLLAVGIGVTVGAIIAVGAALVGLGVKTAEYINHLDEMAKATDIDIQTLAALKGAFDANGGSIDSLAGAVEHLNVLYGQAQEGNKKALDTLLKYGIASDDTARRVDLALKAVGRQTDASVKARLAQELFGKANALVILQMPDLERGLDGIREKYKALSDVVNPTAVEAARKFKEELEKLQETSSTTLHELGAKIIPALNNSLEDFNGALEKSLDTLEKLKKGEFGEFFKNLIPQDTRDALVKLGVLTEKRPEQKPEAPKREPGVGEFGPSVDPADVARAQDAQDAAARARLQATRDALDKEKKQRIESAKAIAAANAANAQAASDAQLKIEQDAAERSIQILDDEFKLGLVEYHDYYDKRLTLTHQSIQAEIDAIGRAIDARTEELRTLQGQKNTQAEQIRVMGELTKLWGDYEIAVKNFGRANDDTSKGIFHTTETLGEQVKLLEDAQSVSNQIKKDIRDAGAAALADPLVQERERLKQSIAATRRLLEEPDANFAARQEDAALLAIAEVADADHKATLAMIRDRVLLADATIFHSTRAQAILLDHLAAQKSVTQSVGDAMIAVYEGVAGAIDKGIGKLTARLGIFGDAVREVLSGITRSILTLFTTTLLGGRGSGGGTAGGGGLGGIVGALGGGGAGGGGILGALFPTLGAAGGGLAAAGGAGSLAALFAPQTAPAFISTGGGLGAQFFGGTGAAIGAPPSLSGAAAGAAGLGAGLSGIFKGFFGPGALPAGLGGSGFANVIAGIGGAGGLAAGALGVGLGAGLGGTSKTGSILGGIGGGILGIGAGIAGTAFGLGATLAVALAPLLGAALIAAPFIVAAILLGRAAQRKKDEALADSYWKGAADQIVELTRQVNSDKIDGQDALTEAIALRSQAVAQISTIKTASVRESRLAHQIPDLDRVYIEPLKRAVEAQARRRATGQSIIPEFATGGVVRGSDRGYDSVLARLRPGEAVLTREQQARIGGEGVLRMAGVPGFAEGGFVSGTSANAGMVIYLDVTLGVSPEEAGSLVVAGATTSQGQKVVVRTVKQAQKNREL